MDNERSTFVTTIGVDRETFLKFKASCILKGTTVSMEIERMMKGKVSNKARSRSAC